MNKHSYKRWVQSDQFTQKLLSILREEGTYPDLSASKIVALLCNNLPPPYSDIPEKHREGWEPYKPKLIMDTIDL